MVEQDQTFKADAGKVVPRKHQCLDQLEARMSIWRRMPDWTFLAGSKDWACLGLSLLPPQYRHIGMYEAFRHGEKKYDTFSWRETENGLERYANAAVRHILPEVFYQSDAPTYLDKESGLHHLSHAAASFAIVLDLLDQSRK